MSKFKIAAATVAALAFLAPATPASAHQSDTRHGKVVSAAAHTHKAGKGKSHSHKAKKVRTAFRLHGTVAAVDTAAGTLTFTVKGGRDKALRRTAVTVTVASNAKVTRDDAVVTLADVVAGDRVNVKGNKVDGVYTAYRVAASSPETETGSDPTTDTGTTNPDSTTPVV